MSELELIEKFKKIPPAYQQEVADFIDFLLEKKINVTSSNNNRSDLLGAFKGKIVVHANFDDPIDGMEEYI